MSNGPLEIKAISGHRGGTPGGGEYKLPDGHIEHSGISHDYDVCKLVDVTTCIGCKACEVACVEWNGYEFRETTFDNTYQTMPETAWNFWNLIKFKEVENDGNMQWLMRKDQCMHCEEPGCLIACPADGAIVQYTNGIVDFNQANCIGCQYCLSGCPFNIPKFNQETKKVYKCTLCSDRVGAGLEPACIKSCPTGCLHFGSKEDMLDLAHKRVEQLHTQTPHKNAGVYDPSGVKGTHVIYVLHDLNKPEQYELPRDPSVPLFIKMWKGPLKWLGGIGIVAGVFGVFMHYIRFGPKEVDEAEEVKP
jgi:formate dehydrogenase beta subunit